MAEQSELAQRGQELATKFMKLEPDAMSGADACIATMMGEFYEWLIEQREVVTQAEILFEGGRVPRDD